MFQGKKSHDLNGLAGTCMNSKTGGKRGKQGKTVEHMGK
jgi:hypothetical protein